MSNDTDAETSALTAKMERFALAIVEGDNQSDAYRFAYSAQTMTDDSIAVEASRLVRDPRIQRRIAELRATLQRALGISRATLLRELDDVKELARSRGDVKALLNVVMSKARLLGFLENPLKPKSPSEIQASSAFGIFDLSGKAE
jgi:hypothetical protein